MKYYPTYPPPTSYLSNSPLVHQYLTQLSDKPVSDNNNKQVFRECQISQITHDVKMYGKYIMMSKSLQ